MLQNCILKILSFFIFFLTKIFQRLYIMFLNFKKNQYNIFVLFFFLYYIIVFILKIYYYYFIVFTEYILLNIKQILFIYLNFYNHIKIFNDKFNIEKLDFINVINIIYYQIIFIFNIINRCLIKFISNYRYTFNHYYLYIIFYLYTIKRYIFYVYNIIKIMLYTLSMNFKIVQYIKDFNYNQFTMRLSYSKVKYWYDYKNFKNKLIKKKKYIKNIIILCNNKLLFFFIKYKANKANYYLFLFIKKCISILVFWKDYIFMTNIIKKIKKKWKKIRK